MQQNPVIQKLNEILDKIEERGKETKTMVMDKLQHEIEKTYSFNALGICKSKLSNREWLEFKDGISRTKTYFEKMKKINF